MNVCVCVYVCYLPQAFVEDTLGIKDLLSHRAQLLHDCSHLILISFSVTVCERESRTGQRGADTQTRRERAQWPSEDTVRVTSHIFKEFEFLVNSINYV